MFSKISVFIFGIFNILINYNCFAFQGRIVNGTMAREGEFPFMVSLRRLPSGRHSCGATLVNPDWVLSAAHCVKGVKPSRVNIQYGANEIDANSTNVVNIAKIIVHENYKPDDLFMNDIALLKLASPVPFNRKVAPVRLPKPDQETPGSEDVTLIGWGYNATGGSIQKNLQKVYIQTFNDDECSALHQMKIHSTNLCAGVLEGGKGQCSGDSGGPLIFKGIQVGIVSWSRKPCTIAPYPGVFTEVSAYVDWIRKTIDTETLAAESRAKIQSLEDSDSDEEFLGGNLIVVRSLPLPLKYYNRDHVKLKS